MGGPWEQYQQTRPGDGPWSQYQQAQSTQPQPVKPETYDSDKGQFADLPVWLRPDNAFNRLTDEMAHGATSGLSSEVKPVTEWAEAIPRWAAAKAGYAAPGVSPAEAYHKAKAENVKKIEQERQEFGLAPEIIGGLGGIRGATAAPAAGRSVALETSAKGAAVPAVEPTLGQRVGSAMKGGAAFGAVSGLTEGDGTLGERALNTIKGAGIGAIAAPLISEVAVPAVAGAANWVAPSADRLGHTVRSIIPGIKADTDRTLFYTLRNQGMSPDDALAAVQKVQNAAKFGNTQLDPHYTIGDTGPATQNLAYTAKATTGPAKAKIQNFLEARSKGSENVENYQGAPMRGQYERVNDYTQRALQVASQKNAAKVEDKLAAKQKAATTPAYDAFYNSGATIPVEDILQSHAQDIASKLTTGSNLTKKIDAAYAPFMDEPHGIGVTQGPSLTEEARYNLKMDDLNKQIAKAQKTGDVDRKKNLLMLQKGLTKQYQATIQPQSLTQISYDLSPEKFDAAKKQLDGMIRAAYKDPDRQYEASLLLDLKHKLIDRAEDVTAIRDAAGNVKLNKNKEPMSLYRAARESYSDPQELLDAIEAGRNFKTEDVDRINETLKAYTAPEKKHYKIGASTQIRQQLGEKGRGANVAQVFSPPNMETRMQAMAGPAKAAQHKELIGGENRMTDTRARVNKGSQTEENKQANDEQNMWRRIGTKLGTWHPMSAAADFVSTSLAHLYRYRQTDAMQLARVLFETDPSRQEAILKGLANRYGQQSVDNALRHARFLTARAISNGVSGNIAAHQATDHAARLNEIENASLHPEQKRDMRRKVFEQAMREP